MARSRTSIYRRGGRRGGGRWLYAVLFLVSSVFACCRDAKNTDKAVAVVDLRERFAQGQELRVIRKGEAKKAVIVVAPFSKAAPLKGLEGKWILQCAAAPVYNIGDGFRMSLYLRRLSSRMYLGGRYFDPGRRAEDRDWISFAVPIEIERGDLLEVEVSGGPQGDLVADWLALASLELARIQS